MGNRLGLQGLCKVGGKNPGRCGEKEGRADQAPACRHFSKLSICHSRKILVSSDAVYRVIPRTRGRRDEKMINYGKRRALLFLAAFLAGAWLLGCTNLCTKRLYLYRDTSEKRLAPANMALLIANPNLARAVSADPLSTPGPGGQWAEDKPGHETDAYRLSIDSLDGKVIYQGLCMDITPTDACEVKPGVREVMVRLDLFGPWGHEKKKEIIRLTLEPGKIYFFRPDPEELQKKNLALKVDPLKDAYTPALRAKVVDWERRHSQGRSLED